jgi:hypothetical protein
MAMSFVVRSSLHLEKPASRRPFKRYLRVVTVCFAIFGRSKKLATSVFHRRAVSRSSPVRRPHDVSSKK